MTSPTSRTLEHLRSEGWQCAVVEKWIAAIRKRQDVWGFIDIIAVKPGHPIKAVQVTSGSNVAARLAKIEEEPRRLPWLAAGGTIEVHGWRKVGPRGKRKRWEVRIVPVTETAGQPIQHEEITT